MSLTQSILSDDFMAVCGLEKRAQNLSELTSKFWEMTPSQQLMAGAGIGTGVGATAGLLNALIRKRKILPDVVTGAIVGAPVGGAAAVAAPEIRKMVGGIPLATTAGEQLAQQHEFLKQRERGLTQDFQQLYEGEPGIYSDYPRAIKHLAHSIGGFALGAGLGRATSGGSEKLLYWLAHQGGKLQQQAPSTPVIGKLLNALGSRLTRAVPTSPLALTRRAGRMTSIAHTASKGAKLYGVGRGVASAAALLRTREGAAKDLQKRIERIRAERMAIAEELRRMRRGQ